MLSEKIKTTKLLHESFQPIFFRIGNADEKTSFEKLVETEGISIYDDMYEHLKELVKSKHPELKLKDADYKVLIPQHLAGCPMDEYGVWVYYPWSSRLVHILDEAEFVDVRTNRNRYKITDEEQALLSTKSIGIVGLSVGQSIALTIAMERICGEIRLADFDTAELSNLNRLRTGIHNLGVLKTVIAAREIAEIDPYLRVKIFNEGLTESNINDFFLNGGKLDLLVEVCDGLDIKIVSRFKARELRVPVVMDTNDRGMLDIERFDLEPERPILHGLAGDLDPSKIKGLTNEEKIPYILKMIGAETISTRLKASMMEVEQSINTWPQLASSVVLGGALTTDVSRKILLDQSHLSGRFYVDFDDMIKDPKGQAIDTSVYDGPPELTRDMVVAIAEKVTAENGAKNISKEKLEAIVTAACLAPSGGNAQAWKFLSRDNALFIFHDEHFSFSLLDYKSAGSYIGFGAMLENIEIKASSLGITAHAHVFPLKDDARLVAIVTFEDGNANNAYQYLSDVIPVRMTNRKLGDRKLLPEKDAQDFIAIAATVPGAKLQIFDKEETIAEFAEILTNTERLRFLHPRGHYDTFVKELRFTPEEIVGTADGLDIATLNMSEGDKAALQIARDPSAINFLHKLAKGEGFKKISRKGVISASGIGVINMDGHGSEHFLNGGRALQRIWLEANHRGISFQPVSQATFMLERYLGDGAKDFNAYELDQLKNIHETLTRLLRLENGRYPVFIFRLFYGAEQKERALRKPLDKVLFVN